jgi:hypothetical protein
MGGSIEYGITFPRAGVAEQPSPWQYLTHLAREAERMGYTYSVIGDRLEAGLHPFSALTAVAEASRPHALTKYAGGRPPESTRSFSSPADQTL